MADPGVISGLIGVGIDIAARNIIYHINIAVRCRKELANLKNMVMGIEPVNRAMQQYRLELNASGVRRTGTGNPLPSAVNNWLKHLNLLLQQADEMVRQCAIPKYDILSRYKTSKRITRIMTAIRGHLDNAALIGITNQLCQTLMLRDGIEHRNGSETGGSNNLIIPSSYRHKRMEMILEPLVVGQEKLFVTLAKLLVNDEGHRYGVVGIGGSGKTLLLKRVYNSKEIRDHFKDGIVAWLTVLQNPSITTLRSELATQIALQTDATFNHKEEDAQLWLHDKLKEKKFALFLDDVWEGSAPLLESLGVPQTDGSKIVVSSRDNRLLLQMGVPLTSTIAMENLLQSESWELFSFHAFLHNYGNPPINIEETARRVCAKCGGLPLAIKVVGAAMAGITQPTEWELTLQKLQNGDSRLMDPQIEKMLYDRLRLSYDALGRYNIGLQLCFLYIGAFKKSQVMIAENLIQLWIGEGLLTTENTPQHRHQYDQNPGSYDLYEVGRSYVNLLADRCLIEARLRDLDGNIIYCSVHDVLHDLVQQIAEREENCLFRAGKDYTVFPADHCMGRTRISLMSSSFASIPRRFRAPQIRSLQISVNRNLKQLPAAVIQSFTSLRVLILTGTSLKTLPESMGRLKSLVCLRLWYAPLERLPNSIVSLKTLEILDLAACTNLKELPSGLSKLTSLKYLDIRFCRNLHFMPHDISLLKSLQYLKMHETPNLWTRSREKRLRKASCIEDLQSLTKLKCLQLQNNGKMIAVGTLGNMIEMKTMLLELSNMTSLPPDMIQMSELKKLELRCPHLVKIQPSFCNFPRLSHLRLVNCNMLEDLPDLHKLPLLRRLEIIECGKLKRFPNAFGKLETFPALEMLSLVSLDALQELRISEERVLVMPQLTTLIIMRCEELKMLPQGLVNLKRLSEIQLYGCSWIDGDADLEQLRSLVNKMEQKTNLIVLTRKDTDDFIKQFNKIYEGGKFWDYGEFWRNKFFQFTQEIFI